MSDPSICKHPLYNSFPTGWNLTVLGPTLIAFYVLEDSSFYGLLAIDILKIKHSSDIYIFSEKEDGKIFIKVETVLGSDYIEECYTIACYITKLINKYE